MKDKLQEAAETQSKHIGGNNQDGRNQRFAFKTGFRSGANYAFEQSKQQIEQLQKERNELREALKNFMDFPIEDLEGWANDKLPVTITVQPSDIKQALGALEKTK